MLLCLQKHLSTSFRLISTVFKMADILKPPETVRGITELDKSLFKKNLKLRYLSLRNINLSTVIPKVKKYLLKLDNLKPIQHDDKTTNILLNPLSIESWTDFPPETQKQLKDLSVDESDLKTREIELCYENFSAEDVFRAVLPLDKEGMSSFTKTGHIVHVNLREHLFPYKRVIGEVLFDKVPGCRSVVNKTNSIDSTYRNFKMEVLKGDEDTLTVVKENNCTFKFDFSTVYWNSRLCTEHERIVKKVKPDDVLFDVFAGVGPFAIPVAKKKCYVYANDLNPESFKWLEYNGKANKVDDKYFKGFNEDGAEFIQTVFKEKLPVHLKNKRKVYITMNLPAIAVEFLKCFVGLYDEDALRDFTDSPVVFVYCFAKGEDCLSIARDLVERSFGFDVSDKILDVFKVRTVSSMKEMMRVTVSLDKDVLLGRLEGKRKLGEASDGESKKFRSEQGCSNEERSP